MNAPKFLHPWYVRLWFRLWAGRHCVKCGRYIWRNDHYFRHAPCAHAEIVRLAEQNGVKPWPCKWCEE